MDSVKRAVQRVVDYLLEDHEDYAAKVFADRLVLRIFNHPSLMTYFRDAVILTAADSQDVPSGVYKFQLKFLRLPREAIDEVKKLIGVPDVRAVEFNDGYMTFTGFEFTIKEADLKA
jgi:hypothetical protein